MDPIVQQVVVCQKENDWIGISLLGDITTQEGGTKFLAEKALNKDTPVLKRAMDAFVTVPLDDWCYDTKGRIFDEFRVTGHGMNLVRCACIARAGYDDEIDISLQIQLSLDCFKRVLEVDSVRLINGDIVIPASYNARYAESWRDKNNRRNDVILRILRLLVKC